MRLLAVGPGRRARCCIEALSEPPRIAVGALKRTRCICSRLVTAVGRAAALGHDPNRYGSPSVR
jgi:hypothetical protein